MLVGDDGYAASLREVLHTGVCSDPATPRIPTILTA